jgi:hypothetical protein
MNRERPDYSERTPWAGWVYAVLWGAVVLGAYPVLAGWDTELPRAARWLVAGGIVSIGAVAHAFLSGLTVRVFADRIVVSLGTVGLFRATVALDDVLAIETVRYRPIREFGGWGIRGRRDKRAWTARGDQAVVLTLPQGRLLYVGSDYPQRLADRIRRVIGERAR